MKKILIVDDENEIVDLLSEFLKNNGYETVGAYDGEEGLEKFESEKPDLVLLDLKMPKKNGYDVCVKIRSVSECPIILITGYLGEMKGFVDAVSVGINDCFTKPVDLAHLLDRIRLLLGE